MSCVQVLGAYPSHAFGARCIRSASSAFSGSLSALVQVTVVCFFSPTSSRGRFSPRSSRGLPTGSPAETCEGILRTAEIHGHFQESFRGVHVDDFEGVSRFSIGYESPVCHSLNLVNIQHFQPSAFHATTSLVCLSDGKASYQASY